MLAPSVEALTIECHFPCTPSTGRAFHTFGEKSEIRCRELTHPANYPEAGGAYVGTIKHWDFFKAIEVKAVRIPPDTKFKRPAEWRIAVSIVSRTWIAAGLEDELIVWVNVSRASTQFAKMCCTYEEIQEAKKFYGPSYCGK